MERTCRAGPHFPGNQGAELGSKSKALQYHRGWYHPDTSPDPEYPRKMEIAADIEESAGVIDGFFGRSGEEVQSRRSVRRSGKVQRGELSEPGRLSWSFGQE